ncbi:tetratricopeptide repeat-containing sulfotransferase family protein [Sphingomonas sp. SRS2]|uniref:tetratricopeptide repeat-containing sulfotransferase family protein n=1 Tax=Sphingomonas sp. SRS2 TaxID=133190 RepID=UPI0006184DD1|nr:tetratricopeptide repeat-containing sulfotransferase family protein [Sphingomonas sp. SRS2]KKC25507.1 sulfotransferase [Sphingomonas sp. SRS2]
MSLPPPHLAPVFARIKIGDLPGALNAAEQILRSIPRDQPLLALAGMLACRTRDLPTGIARLREALALAPEDHATRNNLIRALIESEAFDDAAAICADGGRDPKLLRLAAYVHHRQGRLESAIADYREVVAAFPDDFESWNNLGNLHAAIGDGEGALPLLRKAIELRPDIMLPYVNLSKLLAEMQRFDERQAVMRDAAARGGDDAEVQLELGMAEASMRAFAEAELAFRAAIRLNGKSISAYLELAVLLENLNRVDALAELAAEAEARGLSVGETGFIKAWLLRRQGRFEEALPLAQAIPETINPVRRSQLIAEIADRLGDANTAFTAFEMMNIASLDKAPAGQRDPAPYLDEIRANADQLTSEKIAGWSEISVDPAPPAPIFLVGFPRSGTTLLDTLLMNLPMLHVLEEMPIVRSVETMLGDPARIGEISSIEANALRARYFDTLAEVSPPQPGQRVVDKFPLHMARMGIIHRVFPDAKVIFVERHPCDCVLSGFMSSFELNRAMLSFTSLESAARLYDVASTGWTRAEANLPIDVIRIRYERMVEDLEGEMRRLLGFLDIPWDDKVLDNRGSAAKREHIRTASYSQVTEPIYTRSAGRWERYRVQMKDVLPILKPWADGMGYRI